MLMVINISMFAIKFEMFFHIYCIHLVLKKPVFHMSWDSMNVCGQAMLNRVSWQVFVKMLVLQSKFLVQEM